MTSVAGRLGCPFGQRPWNPGIMVFWYSGIPVSWQPSIRALEGVSESLSRYNCRVRVVQLSDSITINIESEKLTQPPGVFIAQRLDLTFT